MVALQRYVRSPFLPLTRPLSTMYLPDADTTPIPWLITSAVNALPRQGRLNSRPLRSGNMEP